MPQLDGNRRPTTATKVASSAEKADVAIAARLASQRRHPVVRALGAASELGDQLPLLCACGGVLAYGTLVENPRAIRVGVRMLGALLFATAAKTGLKHLISRTRPNVLLDEGRYEIRALGPNEGPWQSFPSGHTAGSVAAACAVARLYPEARWAAYAGAASVALIQVPRGAHYPLDVAAGALLGITAEALVHVSLQHYESRNHPENARLSEGAAERIDKPESLRYRAAHPS